MQGSGWGALSWEPLGERLYIEQIYDHQGNTGQSGVPLLVIDAWEHAYYLQYENRRAEYVDAIWNIIDWHDVARSVRACGGLGSHRAVKSEPRFCDHSREEGRVGGGGFTDLVVVSNRLPLHRNLEGPEPTWVGTTGGLVSALTPVLRGREGVWVGWAGHPGRDRRFPRRYEGIALRAVPIERRGVRRLLPRLREPHAVAPLPRRDSLPELRAPMVAAYVTVNRRYAEAAAPAAAGRAQPCGCTTTTCSSCR